MFSTTKMMDFKLQRSSQTHPRNALQFPTGGVDVGYSTTLSNTTKTVDLMDFKLAQTTHPECLHQFPVPLTYSQAFTNGISHPFVALGTAVWKPYDAVMKPTWDLICDAASLIRGDGYATVGDHGELLKWDKQPLSDARRAAIATAESRMAERYNILKTWATDTVRTIKYGSGPQRVELATGFSTQLILDFLTKGLSEVRLVHRLHLDKTSEALPALEFFGNLKEKSHHSRHDEHPLDSLSLSLPNRVMPSPLAAPAAVPLSSCTLEYIPDNTFNLGATQRANSLTQSVESVGFVEEFGSKFESSVKEYCTKSYLDSGDVQFFEALQKSKLVEPDDLKELINNCGRVM